MLKSFAHFQSNFLGHVAVCTLAFTANRRGLNYAFYWKQFAFVTQIVFVHTFKLAPRDWITFKNNLLSLIFTKTSCFFYLQIGQEYFPPKLVALYAANQRVAICVQIRDNQRPFIRQEQTKAQNARVKDTKIVHSCEPTIVQWSRLWDVMFHACETFLEIENLLDKISHRIHNFFRIFFLLCT